jgi:hypothetical protein
MANEASPPMLLDFDDALKCVDEQELEELELYDTAASKAAKAEKAWRALAQQRDTIGKRLEEFPQKRNELRQCHDDALRKMLRLTTARDDATAASAVAPSNGAAKRKAPAVIDVDTLPTPTGGGNPRSKKAKPRANHDKPDAPARSGPVVAATNAGTARPTALHPSAGPPSKMSATPAHPAPRKVATGTTDDERDAVEDVHDVGGDEDDDDKEPSAKKSDVQKDKDTTTTVTTTPAKKKREPKYSKEELLEGADAGVIFDQTRGCARLRKQLCLLVDQSDLLRRTSVHETTFVLVPYFNIFRDILPSSLCGAFGDSVTGIVMGDWSVIAYGREDEDLTLLDMGRECRQLQKARMDYWRVPSAANLQVLNNAVIKCSMRYDLIVPQRRWEKFVENIEKWNADPDIAGIDATIPVIGPWKTLPVVNGGGSMVEFIDDDVVPGESQQSYAPPS